MSQQINVFFDYLTKYDRTNNIERISVEYIFIKRVTTMNIKKEEKIISIK